MNFSPLLRWPWIVAGLLVPAGTLAATAADTGDLTALPFEQLLTMEVFSASKFVQKYSEAPASVTVITAAEIRSHGWRTLAEVARSVPGLYVSDDRNYSYLGARGFLRPGDYNTRFLLLVDGNRINDAVYDQAPLGGEFPLELDLVERIEFVPGPGSSIYGSNAFLGVINVITRKPGSMEGARAALDVGSEGARKVSASTGWRSGATSILLAASRHRSSGADLYFPEFDDGDPRHHGGIASSLDYERGTRLFASAVNGNFSLTVMHAERTKGIPTAAFLQPFNDPRARTIDRQSYVNGAWRSLLESGEQLKLRLFAGRYDSLGDYAVDDGAGTLSHDGSKAGWWGAELNLVSTRWRNHTLVAGLDFQRDYKLQQSSFEITPAAGATAASRIDFLDSRRSASRSGVFLQDEITLGPALLLNLGVRADHNSGSGGATSPRGALIYAASAATTFKAIYGAAFRAPNSYEKYYSYPGFGGQIANPDLRNEKIRTASLSVEHAVGSSARLTAGLFRNAIQGVIALFQNPDGQQTRFDNAPRLRADGAELGYEHSWRGGAALRASYVWVRLGDGGGALDLSAPLRMGKLNLSAPAGFAGVRAAFETQYVASRRGPIGTAPAYLVANANLVTSTLLPGLEASLGVTNLFDRSYADPGSYEHVQAVIAQDGRRVRMRLAYAF